MASEPVPTETAQPADTLRATTEQDPRNSPTLPRYPGSADARQIADLARRVKITTQQRQFADLRLADPARTQASIAREMDITESRAAQLARHPKVRAYLDGVDNVAIRKAAASIAKRREVLARLTQQARGLQPTKTETINSASGTVTKEIRDTHSALARLLDHSEFREKGPANAVQLHVFMQALEAHKGRPQLALSAANALDAELVQRQEDTPTATSAASEDEDIPSPS